MQGPTQNWDPTDLAVLTFIGCKQKTKQSIIQQKNPPNFENYLKWPTFRATVKTKIIYRKGAGSALKT